MQNIEINFNKYFKLFNIFSISLITISLVLLVFKGLNFGIDFKGGTLIELRSIDNQTTISQIRQSFLNMNLGNVTVKKFGKNNVILVCAETENQIMELDPKDRKHFMTESGIKETGLNLLIKTGYEILKLETFFTSGPEESRAWTIPIKTKALKAAGIIHSDFEKGFIRAETISYEDFVNFKDEVACREAGKLRQEGKEYIVKDGDIFQFLFNI